jgi:hypothetical protein
MDDICICMVPILICTIVGQHARCKFYDFRLYNALDIMTAFEETWNEFLQYAINTLQRSVWITMTNIGFSIQLG